MLVMIKSLPVMTAVYHGNESDVLFQSMQAASEGWGEEEGWDDF